MPVLTLTVNQLLLEELPASNTLLPLWWENCVKNVKTRITTHMETLHCSCVNAPHIASSHKLRKILFNPGLAFSPQKPIGAKTFKTCVVTRVDESCYNGRLSLSHCCQKPLVSDFKRLFLPVGTGYSINFSMLTTFIFIPLYFIPFLINST